MTNATMGKGMMGSQRALRPVCRIGKLPDDTWAEPDKGIPITQTQ